MFNYVYVESEKSTGIMPEGHGSFRVEGYYLKKKDGSPHKDNGLGIRLKVKAPNGGEYMVFDTLSGLKVKFFLESIGMGYLYNKGGQLDPEQIVGQIGECEVIVSDNPGFGAKNFVRKYIKNDLPPVSLETLKSGGKLPKIEAAPEDDDIPF